MTREAARLGWDPLNKGFLRKSNKAKAKAKAKPRGKGKGKARGKGRIGLNP